MKKRVAFIILALATLTVLALPSASLAGKPTPQITNAVATHLPEGTYQYRIDASFTGRPYAWNYVVHHAASEFSWPTNFVLTRDEIRSGAFARSFSFTSSPVSIDLQLFDRKGNPLGDPHPCTMQ